MSIEKCIDKYQEFLNTISDDVEDDFVRLGNLISCNKLSEFDEPIEFVTALHNISDRCYRITNKKTQYYIHRYDPSFIHELVRDLDYKEQILNIFDLTPREGCCNCVSFVCYSGGVLNLLFDYLYSQKKSLDNIANNLDGFIAKFYFDSSIFETIYNNYSTGNEFQKNLSIKCYKILKYILSHYKAETYIYFCKMIVEGLPLAKVRTLRFLPMFEPDVNIRVIREADGFVSYLDCHNIKLFAQVNKIGMFYEFADSLGGLKDSIYIPNERNMTWHYSAWLKTYSKLKYLFMTSEEHKERFIQYVQDNYNQDYTRPPDSNIFLDGSFNYMNYIKLFDVLAGTLAFKVKFSNVYLNEKINLISEIYTYSERFSDQLNKYPSTEIKVLHVGYDEILLLEIFEPIITLNKANTSIHPSKADEIKKILDKDGLEGVSRYIDTYISNLKTNILSLFVFIFNKDDIMYDNETSYYFYGETTIIFKEDFVQSIIGTKTNLLNEQSEYRIEQIVKPEYKSKIEQLIKEIKDAKLGSYTIHSKDRKYGFVIDYLVDLAYKPEYLLPEFTDYFYNIGINLLNKKFFNVGEWILSIWHSDNPETNDTINQDIRDYLNQDIEKLNIFYTEIYPQSNSEPNVNYKSKYLKYKQKYLLMKKLLNK